MIYESRKRSWTLVQLVHQSEVDVLRSYQSRTSPRVMAASVVKTLEDKIESTLYELLGLGGGNGATLTKYAKRIAAQARRDLVKKPAVKKTK